MTAAATLKGGLDLRRSKPIVPPGRLLDCKNYETTTDVEGYKPIDGFDRYDGRMSPSTHDVWQITIPTADITNTFVVGDRLVVGGVLGTGVEFGVLIATAVSGLNTLLTFAYWPGAESLLDGDVIYGSVASFAYRAFNVKNSGGTTFNVTPVVLDNDGNKFTVASTVLNSAGTSFTFMSGSIQHVTEYKNAPLTLFTELGAVGDALRPLIGVVPGQGPVLASKRFEGITYAIRSYFDIGFDAGGTNTPELNQRILDASGNEGIVHAIQESGGDWGLSTAVGILTVDAYDPAFSIANNDQLDLVGEIQFSSGSAEPSAGDVISGQSSSSTATIQRVRVDTGTFLGGDAKGVIYITGESAAFTATELIDNDTSPATNVLTCDEQTHTSQNNFIDATAITKTHSKAGMWESSRAGWTRIDLGWEINYDTGTNAPPTIDLGGSAASVAADAEDTGWVTALSVDEATDTAIKTAWTGLSAANLAVDDGVEATVVNDDTDSVDATVYNFPFSLDSSDTPLGFELEFRTFRSAGTADGWFGKMMLRVGDPTVFPLEKYTSYRSDYPVKPLNTATEFTHTVGGVSDDWGGWLNSGGEITADDVNSADFGARFAIQNLTPVGTSTYNVDRVRMRVTYLPAGAKVYFWDSAGSNDLGHAILTNDYISTGDYATNDAAGTYSLAELTRFDFGSGIQIRTAAAGGGTLIATTTAAPKRVSLAGITALNTEDSIYQLIVANFFAADTLNALYGVSGAGLSFVYDGIYFRQIRTGVLEINDKPRHLAAFQFRLILAYKWGEESWSVAGSPLSFDGTLNAVATGYGFNITGIAELSGQMLGTFTNGGVFGTVVSGSNFDQKILSPGSRVIEYSVQNFGDETVFCDQNGVRTLASTDKYGDFEAGTLSRDANKWLRPRLRRKPLISPRNGRFVNSTVVRSKGQYRMFFADGQYLTMTWDLVEEPEFTLQKLWLDSDESNAFARVLATSSDTDEDGTEHVYFSIYERPEYDHGTDLGYVFQSEAGTSFDGDAITAFATLSWLNVNDPVKNKRFTKWQLHGLAYNYATPTIDFAVDLTEPDGAGAETLKIGKTTNSSTLEQKPFFTKPRSKKRGRNISVRFDHNSSTELPHLLQLLVSVDESAGRKEI